MAKQGKPRIAIIGAGLGGTTAAALLQQAGFPVKVYEQAPGFARLGAGIHLGPNVMKVMRRVGIEPQLMEIGVRPATWLSRAWDSGDVMFELPLADAAEAQYGAPYLTLHRGDFHAALTDAAAPGTIEFGKRLVGLEPTATSVRLAFADGSNQDADLVIGADGVNSKVREILLGPAAPTYTGYVAHRAVFPKALLGDFKVDDCTKWWSEDRHMVVYYVTRSREEVYFVTGVPEPEWATEASWVDCSVEDLRAAFDGYHPEVQRLIDACPAVTKWPLLDRDPLPLWSRGRIVLLGDACHPMKPHMAQGAGMAIEDAAMLTRCLDLTAPDGFEEAFNLFEANRIARTSRVQRESHNNTWLRDGGDPSWVFGYDVFDEPIAR